MITASQPKNILSLVVNINFRKTQGRNEKGGREELLKLEHIKFS